MARAKTRNGAKAGPTIETICAEFLAEKQAKVGAATFAKYRSIVQLYQAYLESYWPGHEGEYDAVAANKQTYCGTFGAEDIGAGFSMFLGDFVPRKVMAGPGTINAAGTVIKAFAKWLVGRGLVPADRLDHESVKTLSGDLPKTQKLLERFQDWLDEAPLPIRSEPIEGHFLIQRVEAGQIWLEPFLAADLSQNEVLGPIDVPPAIARACKVGWDLGGVVARTARGWQILNVWTLSP